MNFSYNKTLNDLIITDSMSFAFRPKNFFNQIYSFYYIRILFREKNKNIIYPIEPNIGNICIPEEDKGEKRYFCKCRLKNNHKELSLDNYIAIYAQDIDSNQSISKPIERKDENLYKINLSETTPSAPYIELLYYFLNKKIVYISLSSIYKNRSSINPQIYSSEMFYLKQNIDFNLNLKHNFSLFLSYINGDGEIKYNNLSFQVNINFQQKHILFRINKANQIFNVIPLSPDKK